MAKLGSIVLNGEIEAELFEDSGFYAIVFYRYNPSGQKIKIVSENATDLTEYLLNKFGWMRFQLSDNNKEDFKLIWHDPDV